MRPGDRSVLAFAHPRAGHQLVKGTLEPGELPRDAALRELAEEAGIRLAWPLQELGEHMIGRQPWAFVLCATPPLPDTWTHWCRDDGGHLFRLFWQPIDDLAPSHWHPLFHQALAVIRLAPAICSSLHPNTPAAA